MIQKIKRSFLSLLLMVALSACNLQLVDGSQAQGEGAELILTITAQALILEQAGQPVLEEQNQAIVVVTATPDGAASATPEAVVAAPVVAPATGAVTVTVSIATNCRTGPGQAYPIIYGQPLKQVSEVVGKNTSTNYWIIKIPNGNGTCWLWGQYATVTGDTSSLQTVAIPPTPTPTKTSTATITPTLAATSTPTITATLALQPAAPSNLSEQNTCTLNPNAGFKYVTSGTVTWQDNSNNEKGFNVYWNSNFVGANYALIGTVGPNTTSLGFSQTTYSDFKATVKVEAFNDVGKSESTPVKVVLNCPP